MIRALETGEIATDRPKENFRIDSRIKERSFGKWDGKYREELDAKCLELGMKNIFKVGYQNNCRKVAGLYTIKVLSNIYCYKLLYLTQL